MNLVKPPAILRHFLLRSLIWQIPDRKKEIFLTFDDGPVPEATPKILEILAKYRAKATFFCVGDNITKYPEVYQQIIDAGHTTGNHTNNHLSGWNTNKEDYLENILACDKKVNSKWFRPPYGRINVAHIAAIKQQGFKIVMWSVLTQDYDVSLTGEEVLENALKYTTDGSIVVFHDSIKATGRVMYALPKYLEHFSRLGYTFSALP